MRAYRTKAKKLPGTNFREVRRSAFGIYAQMKRGSRRKPYVRSAFFKKEKIFLDLFWTHLFEKRHFPDIVRRLKFYPCALELIQKSTFEPISKENPNRTSEILHRFAGVTSEDEVFYVQIKEVKKGGKKWLMSVFPVDRWR